MKHLRLVLPVLKISDTYKLYIGISLRMITGAYIPYIGTILMSGVGQSFCSTSFLVCSARGDLWSLGVVAFVLLFGYMPFSGAETKQIRDIKAPHEKWRSFAPCGRTQRCLYV